MSLFWDAISLSLIPLIAAPIGIYIRTKNPAYIPVIMSIVITEIIISFSRQLPVIHPVMLRPTGAKNCNIFNSGGSYDGQIGMPSGHMMLTTCLTFSMLFLYARTKNLKTLIVLKPIAGASATGYVILMGVSRLMRGCHNIPQVIMGGLLGFGLAYTLY
jgi:membrane-associated phospholipid phosphatase